MIMNKVKIKLLNNAQKDSTNTEIVMIAANIDKEQCKK